jgi:hypothetical protein
VLATKVTSLQKSKKVKHANSYNCNNIINKNTDIGILMKMLITLVALLSLTQSFANCEHTKRYVLGESIKRISKNVKIDGDYKIGTASSCEDGMWLHDITEEDAPEDSRELECGVRLSVDNEDDLNDMLSEFFLYNRDLSHFVPVELFPNVSVPVCVVFN